MRKVLIADDSSTNTKLIREILQNHYDIISVTDGPSCLKAAMDLNPDLILLDVMMPEINGYDVCRKLKSDSLTENIPVIFITAKKIWKMSLKDLKREVWITLLNLLTHLNL